MKKKIKLLGDTDDLKDVIEGDSGIVPLLNEKESADMMDVAIPPVLPVLALRNTVLFPGVVMPITVGRQKSLNLVQDAYDNKDLIGTLTQKDENVEDPGNDDLYHVGVLARIIKLFDMPDGTKTLVVQGIKAIKIGSVITDGKYLLGVDVADYPCNDFQKNILEKKEFNATISSLSDMMTKFLKLSVGPIPEEAFFAFKSLNNRVFMINFIISNLPIEVSKKQRILEISDIEERAMAVLVELSQVLQMAQLKVQIQKKAKLELDKQQKEYFLNQQLKTIQEELGDNGVDSAVAELKEKTKNKKWDAKTKKHFDKELQKLQRMNPMAPDFTTQLNYLDLMAELPWNEYTADNLDLEKVRAVLDEDHFGLDKIKERIVEYLAVLKLKGDMKSPILCFVGPPGVGKTSLGKSVARAMNRKYIRMSLGGMHDESEIRGHRKTYIGAMPGRIVENIRKAGSANPVFVLDEIDKLSGMTIQGDPSAAMLEVLDPEQNSEFYDNYLDTTFDLSRILFIATANSLNTIHPALRDRMEVIELSSYLVEEKINIAKRHLIPRQIKEHGLKQKDISFSDKVIEHIITDYTREAGVRILEKLLAKIIRNRACKMVKGEPYSKTVKQNELANILGVPIYKSDDDYKTNMIGVAKGLAWTAVGGEVLFVETALSEGKGNITLTGNLGDVMKESATIAYEYMKIHAKELHIDMEKINNKDVYVHFPEGAIPKDGPSAGITILTALISTFTHTPIRPNLAMTGEITLRGKITPIGGVKEKILAAKRANITTLVLPLANRKDVEDVEKEYVEGLDFHYFDNMTDALKFNLMIK
ncbi:MAG: endopeptidase La [Bacteroidales bacterium]|nr:endopeptidase La [Bacteroidales bacterium]